MNRFVFCVLAISLLPYAALAADPKCTEPSIAIDVENLTGGDQKDFEDDLRAATIKVCNWWGPSYTGAFTVSVEDSRGPSMALVPGWRGNRGTMLFRTRPTRAGGSAIVHEVVHVFAPNNNRFLAEGFAVYAQEHLSDRTTYPNFRHELHQFAKEFLDSTDLSAMDSRALPKRLQTDDLTGKEAYIVAGSFFEYLIKTHGMEKFRRLYAMTPMVPRSRGEGGSPGRWAEVYGSDLKTLEKGWKKFVDKQ